MMSVRYFPLAGLTEKNGRPLDKSYILPDADAGKKRSWSSNDASYLDANDPGVMQGFVDDILSGNSL